jgi:hypothetical protein
MNQIGLAFAAKIIIDKGFMQLKKILQTNNFMHRFTVINGFAQVSIGMRNDTFILLRIYNMHHFDIGIPRSCKRLTLYKIASEPIDFVRIPTTQPNDFLAHSVCESKKKRRYANIK